MIRSLAGIALALAATTASAGVSVSDGRYAMGTILEITLVAPDREAGTALLEALYAEVARIERAMTLFDAASDLSRLNREAGGEPVRVDPDLVRVLALSIDYAARTRGAFDVTVGPLVALWQQAAARNEPPTPAALAAARARVGIGALDLRPPDRAAIRSAGVSIDLGGIAKGYALDRLAERVRAAGVPDALLSFGQSSLWAIGKPPDGPGWRLLVRRPDGGFAGEATLSNRAVSVSGSLGQSSEIAGRRYGHVIDPRTGDPLVRALEAFVVCENAALAEAASKALLVLAEQEGIAVLGALACEGLLVGEGGKRHQTPGFAAATTFEAASEEPDRHETRDDQPTR